MVFMILMAALAPLVAPFDPFKAEPLAARQAPSLTHLMGTDHLGRDVFSRIIFGTRLSLRVGLISVSIAAVAGVVIGVTAGYYGGVLDAVSMRIVDLMLAFPGMLLALVIVFLLGPSLTNAMIAVGVAGIPTFARLVRGLTISQKENDYVQAARAVGAGDFSIVFRHILPNIIAPVIVMATLTVASAIVFCAGLSFLGLGAQPPLPEWGSMLNSGRLYIRTAWWMTVFPGVMIMITALSINLVGDGLRDALDPRLKR